MSHNSFAVSRTLQLHLSTHTLSGCVEFNHSIHASIFTVLGSHVIFKFYYLK